MFKPFASVVAVLATVAMSVAEAKPKAGYAKEEGLSLTVSLDKKAYAPADDIDLRFALKNETDRALFVGDGFLAPDYHEAGPSRHFEVHVKAGGKDPLYFWSGSATEGSTAGIRKVFKLKPGDEYKGHIRLVAGTGTKVEGAKFPQDLRGGGFENIASRKRHTLGKDGTQYTVELRYQVDPKTHGVWKPPADFKDELMWQKAMTSAPLEFEVSAK